MRRALTLVAPLLWMALIFAGSSIPGKRLPSTHVWDKLAHATEYAILGALAYRALRAAGLSRERAVTVAVAGCALYGASDEWHQSFVPHRSVEAADALADTVGGAIGAALALLWERRSRRLTPSRAAPAGS